MWVHSLDMKHTALIAVALVIGCIVIAYSLYQVQASKNTSIEKQQQAEEERLNLAMKQDECESLSDGVRDRWNNVVGVTYDADLWEECVVTYTNTKTGEIETSPLRFMSDVKK